MNSWRKCPECGQTQGVHAPDCPAFDAWYYGRLEAEIQGAESPLAQAVAAVQAAGNAGARIGSGIWQIHYEPQGPQQADTIPRPADIRPATPEEYLKQVARENREAHEKNALYRALLDAEHDKTNPSHYRQHPSGVECIAITEHMGFNLGNAVKYIWRADLKHETPLDDLKKARWYLDREIQRLGG